MHSQTSLSPVDYDSPYNNIGQLEGSQSPDYYPHTQTADSYQYPSTQGSPQGLEEAAAPAVDYSATFDDTNDIRVYLHPLNPFRVNVTIHPIRGVFAVTGYDGTVIRVYGPPLSPELPKYPDFPLLSQEDSRVEVPQLPYRCGNVQKKWDPKPPILFFKLRRLGVKLSDATGKEFKGMDDRDESPFDEKRGITIRIHFPGYPSSTDVEKKLKQLAKGSENPKARSMQLSTKNYKAQAEPVTKSKLVQEVAKRIHWHITDLENNADLFPFDEQFDEKWRLGQGKMTFEYMVITGLINVSSGSWSPVIFIE